VIKTSSLTGFLLLYGLAGMRRWRRGSLRFEGEYKAIHRWLQMIPSLAAENYALALEVAECPRLIKGYGETHANGMRNFNVIMGAVSRVRGRQDAAAIIRKLREVALADESGKKLDRALQEISP
jgi:indolepyruvate ferredoxin oxidoreductase beta subunit